MPQDEWDLRYRAPSEPEAEVPDVPPGLGAKVMRLLTWLILVLLLLGWAVVGAVFWLPLVLRTMFGFSVALIQATMEGSKPTAAARMLKDAVGFYRRGFVVAVEAVMGPEDEEDQRRGGGVDGRRLVKELAWASLAWYAVFLLAGVDLPTPIELFNGFVGLPWGDWVQGVGGWLDGLFDRSAPPPTSG